MFLVHTDHIFEGVILIGCISLFVQLNLLGVDGISTRSLLAMEGRIAPVELTGVFPTADGVALLVKAGGTGWSIGKAEISGAGRFEKTW